MPPRRSEKAARAVAGADPEMRKLEASLAILRRTAREYAEQTRAKTKGPLKVLSVAGVWRSASGNERTERDAVAQPARPVLKRVVMRLRELGRQWLR
jgi:hypothetical protein